MDDGLSFASWSNRDMTFYQERLQSFKDWPKQLIPDKFSLAKAGFYYTGEHDKVQCFACSVKITRWERTDDPWLEHKKWSSQCVYLKITGCGEEKPCEHPMQISVAHVKPRDLARLADSRLLNSVPSPHCRRVPACSLTVFRSLMSNSFKGVNVVYRFFSSILAK